MNIWERQAQEAGVLDASANPATSDAAPNVPSVEGAREARYAEAIEDGLFRMHGITSSCDHREEGRAVIAVADAELAPLVARVAELEAEVERSRNAHARAIVQLSECMERAEKAEADLLNAWLAVEDVTDEVDRGGSLADYITALTAAGPAVSDAAGPHVCSEKCVMSVHPGTSEAGVGRRHGLACLRSPCDDCEAEHAARAAAGPALSDGGGATSEARTSNRVIARAASEGHCTSHVEFTSSCLWCGIARDSLARATASPVVAPSATDEGDPLACVGCGGAEADCPGLPASACCCRTCAHYPRELLAKFADLPAPGAVPSGAATDGTTPTKEA